MVLQDNRAADAADHTAVTPLRRLQLLSTVLLYIGLTAAVTYPQVRQLSTQWLTSAIRY